MFTGIIQGEGEVLSLRGSGSERRIMIRPQFDLPNIINGESIAINGVCLSVESNEQGAFTAYASGETISRTTLGALKTGDRVNMERALALGERLGGHLVSGHVDCLATVRSVTRAGQSLCCRLAFPAEYSPEVIQKGSVALDGISLTINACGSDFLEVNIIPDTQKRTPMRHWRPGTPVNMETDLIGKYVRNMISPWIDGGRSETNGTVPQKQITNLTREFLLRSGFI